MGTRKITHGEHLQSAFADFERASDELKEFYASLEERVAGLVCTLRDFEKSESELLSEKAELNSRLTSLLEALPAGVVELSRDGTIAHANPAAKHLLGGMLEGEQWSDVVGRAFLPRWDDGHDISLGDGRRVNIETAALVGRSGQILLIKDVTETRRLQERLSLHQRLSAKTEVAAALAHQVRTPLSTAILYLTNLRQSGLSKEGSLELIEKALKGMRHIETIVSDMLMFSRDHKFEMEIIDLKDLLESLTVCASDDDTKVVIEQCTPEGDETSVRVNRDALLSVIQNLIDNAISAGAKIIRIVASVERSIAKVSVIDNGPGIEESIQNEIFEPFYSTKTQGNGLGLAIARSICRAHSGDLILEHESGHGACVSLVLPLFEKNYREQSGLKQAF